MAAIDTFLNLTGLKRVPLVRQAEAAECGLACLAMIAAWHGYDTDLNTLRRRFPISLKGTTLKDLIDVASRIGLGSRALRCEPEELRQLRLPCVLHWEFKHFVVLHRVKGNRFWLNDPAIGSRVLGAKEMSAGFTGVVLELSPTPTFTKRRERNPVRLGSLLRWSPETVSSLAQGFLMSLLLELFVVLSPYYLQLVIDEAILKGDHDLLLGLGIGFGVLTLFNAAASALRGLVFQFLANVISFDMEARLFHHLIRLPLDYFQKRSLGDLLQRFHALEPIKQLIVNGGIAAVLDGMLALFTGALMLIYSVKLAAIVIGVFLLYLAIRIGALQLARRFAADTLISDAREQTRFLETIRAMQTIKVSGGESNREGLWRNLYAAKLNATIKSGNLTIAYQTLNTLLQGLSDVVIIYLAAGDAIGGLMTVGVISAFMAYKGQFMSRLSSLVDQAIQFRLLDVQLDRVADIALAAREKGLEAPALDEAPIIGAIEAKGLSFRYAPSEKAIVAGLDLAIRPGEFVAIIGPSGEGKSTLLKLLIGLYEPSAGEVAIDGRPLHQIGTSRLRRQLGVVMQEDQLLAGTIAENIALFDEQIDMEHVRLCARAALIEDEILRFPMQFNSLVGDMGTTLSSGQKQRVLIARALYRKPRILVMDEGTAHLDPAREALVNQMIRGLPITRLVVAHSPALMRQADRVLELRDGTLREIRIDTPVSAIASAPGMRTRQRKARPLRAASTAATAG
jgi:ATP-binding cassette, subfamily B, bacterial CvaB/MchF/RaxB